MTTVACVLRSGGVYTPEWVHALRRQVDRHLHVDHRFVCLSEWHLSGVCTRLLRHDWPGYWSKLELYRPELFEGRVLYLDLDLLVVDDITALTTYEGHMAAVRDHYHDDVRSSSVVLFDGDDPPPLYERAIQQQPEMYRTRRSDLWWNQHVEAEAIQDTHPGLIGSYKADGLHDGPGEYGVVDFHGKPKPPDVDGWPREVWEDARGAALQG